MAERVRLDLEVTPTSLQSKRWAMTLGSPFSHCVTILKQLDTDITDIQVWYSAEAPLGQDLVLNLAKDGIRLIFDSYTQCMKMIEVYNMDKLSLRYHGKPFNSPTVVPTIEQIHQSFGCTTPCKSRFDENKQIFVMSFRGLDFLFTTDTHEQTVLVEDTGFQRLSLPPGVTAKVTKMQIYHGISSKESGPPDKPLSIYSTGVSLLERADVVRSGNTFKSLSLTLKTRSQSCNVVDNHTELTTVHRQICLGLCCQEVASQLGAPTKIFHKSDDKMRIHSREADRSSSVTQSDYIYNYFSLGMDLVFDGASHKMKKIILHTNYPGHYDFNVYMRCSFNIPLCVDVGTEHRMSNPYQSDQLNITPYTKWNDIEQYCPMGTIQKPVVLKRTPSVNSTNPFGPTLCYGIQDMIFEVMMNKHIASVIIYQH